MYYSKKSWPCICFDCWIRAKTHNCSSIGTWCLVKKTSSLSYLSSSLMLYHSIVITHAQLSWPSKTTDATGKQKQSMEVKETI